MCQYNNEEKSLIWFNSDYNSANWNARPKDTGLIYVTFTKLHNDRFIYERLKYLSCICKTLLGFTATLQSHCVPRCPPVSQWLEHSGPVCQLVDICLLPPLSVVMAANPPLSPPDPSPSLAGLLHPFLVFPLDTSCEPLMLILQSTSASLVMSTTLFPKLYFDIGNCALGWMVKR